MTLVYRGSVPPAVADIDDESISLSYQDSNGGTSTNDFTPQGVTMAVKGPGTFTSGAAVVTSSLMAVLMVAAVVLM